MDSKLRIDISSNFLLENTMINQFEKMEIFSPQPNTAKRAMSFETPKTRCAMNEERILKLQKAPFLKGKLSIDSDSSPMSGKHNSQSLSTTFKMNIEQQLNESDYKSPCITTKKVPKLDNSLRSTHKKNKLSKFNREKSIPSKFNLLENFIFDKSLFTFYENEIQFIEKFCQYFNEKNDEIINLFDKNAILEIEGLEIYPVSHSIQILANNFCEIKTNFEDENNISFNEEENIVTICLKGCFFNFSSEKKEVELVIKIEKNPISQSFVYIKIKSCN